MAMYEYRCVTCAHVTVHLRHPDLRRDITACERCGAFAPVIFSVPRVQNLTASENSLTSWGRNMRAGGSKSLARKIAETDAARRAGPNKAAEAAI